MTVKELIAVLAAMPQDYEVVYQCMSDQSVLTAEAIEVVPASEKRHVRHHNMPGQIREYREWEFDGSGITPEFVDVVAFPGN